LLQRNKSFLVRTNQNHPLQHRNQITADTDHSLASCPLGNRATSPPPVEDRDAGVAMDGSLASAH